MAARQANRLIPSQKLQLNTSLANALRVLRFDAAGLSRYLEEQAAENAWLRLSHPQPPVQEWSQRWHTAFSPATGSEAALSDFTAAPDPSLMAHVTARCEAMFAPGRPRRIATAFVLALEPSGWLGRPLPLIAEDAGASLAEAEATLQRLQQMEPTGLFARSLAECLQLQAIEAGYLDPVMACVLQHLDLLAAGRIAHLAGLCGVEEAAILLRLRRIRGFDPKPGSLFGQGAAPLREPDLITRKTDNGWDITLNRSSLPALEIGAAPARPDAAVRGSITAAKALARMVRSRNETLLAIASAVFARQPELLDQGPEYLRPMTMAAIAEDLGHHESTISRAVAGVSIDTPRGVIWLRSLFSTSTGEGGGPSAGALRAKLARLIAGENPQAPLSDQDLAERLATPAAPLARRTVAKYRGLLNIPAAHRRRQRIAPDKPGPGRGNSA